MCMMVRARESRRDRERYRENSGCKSVNGRVIYSAWFSYVPKAAIFIAMAIWIDNVEMSFSSFVLYTRAHTHTPHYTIMSHCLPGAWKTPKDYPNCQCYCCCCRWRCWCCSAAAATWFYLLFLTQKRSFLNITFISSKIYDFESW